jgi:hypothetical protein
MYKSQTIALLVFEKNDTLCSNMQIQLTIAPLLSRYRIQLNFTLLDSSTQDASFGVYKSDK